MPATSYFIQHYEYRKKKLEQSNINKSKPENQAKRRKRKRQSYKTSQSKKARQSYGPETIDSTPDVPEDELQKTISKYSNENPALTCKEIADIERNTREQSSCGLWHKMHKKTLTSSNFGKVMARKITTKSVPLVSTILYPKFSGNVYTKHGLEKENITIKEYIQHKARHGEHVTVVKSGLVLDKNNQELGASPDGIVINKDTNECGVLEIKNLLYKKPYTLEEATKKCGDFCLQPFEDSFHLKMPTITNVRE